MSFKIKTVLLLLTISFIPYIFTMYIFGSSFKEEQLKSVTQEMNTQLNMTIDRIESQFKNLQKDIKFIAKSELMVDFFTKDLDLRISRMLSDKKKDLLLKGELYLIDKNLKIIASSDFNKIGKILEESIDFSASVYSPFDKSIAGLLVVSYDLENIMNSFTNVYYRHYYIILNGSQEYFRPKIFEKYISIKKRLPSIPSIEIVLEENKNYAYRLINKYQFWFFVILSIGGIFIIIIAIYFAEYLIRPLRKLCTTANTIAQTQNYTTHLSIDRDDEIGQMGRSFNEMIESINDAMNEITSLNDEVEDTQREIVFTMGTIAERRSKETGNHVKRVAAYTKLLALHLGLDEKEAEMLRQASPMHDIGKIAIPDAILNKPGKFSDEEQNIMNSHAKLGYDMLKMSNRTLLKMSAIVAYEHHEKYDGTGYPRGLKGSDIHIYGRITAVADVFDALGSDRVYKKAWPDDEIFVFFKDQKGKHFDPELIDIFFNNLNQFLSIRDEFKDLIP